MKHHRNVTMVQFIAGLNWIFKSHFSACFSWPHFESRPDRHRSLRRTDRRAHWIIGLAIDQFDAIYNPTYICPATPAWPRAAWRGEALIRKLYYYIYTRVEERPSEPRRQQLIGYIANDRAQSCPPLGPPRTPYRLPYPLPPRARCCQRSFMRSQTGHENGRHGWSTLSRKLQIEATNKGIPAWVCRPSWPGCWCSRSRKCWRRPRIGRNSSSPFLWVWPPVRGPPRCCPTKGERISKTSRRPATDNRHNRGQARSLPVRSW